MVVDIDYSNPSKSSVAMRYIFHPLNRKISKAIEEAIFAKCKIVFEENSDDRYDSPRG